MGWFPMCVAFLVVLRLVAQVGLEAINRKETRRNAAQCPPELNGVMDPPTYRKAVQYTLAKGRFASTEAAFEAVVLLVVLFSGGLPWLWARTNPLSPGAAWSGALFLAAAMALIGLLNLPLAWWGQFRLEERFGFNHSTPGLWTADQFKATLLALGIGFPVSWALLALVKWTGSLWWIWAFVFVFVFQLVMIVLYPKLILPLFNTLSPLAEGELRDRLLALSQRTGFRANTIQTMDGSKRSGHSNAFFTGFGRFRRIVFFDTLMAQLAPSELEAVLAHEIGHYKCGHIPKFMALMALLQFGAFAAIGWLAGTSWFNASFGLPNGMLAPTFLLAALLGGLVTFWFSPLGNALSRRNEFEADAFAFKAVGSGSPLVGALRKLSQKNLSNLTPHPLYSVVYYSHPPLIERERALEVLGSRIGA